MSDQAAGRRFQLQGIEDERLSHIVCSESGAITKDFNWKEKSQYMKQGTYKMLALIGSTNNEGDAELCFRLVELQWMIKRGSKEKREKANSGSERGSVAPEKTTRSSWLRDGSHCRKRDRSNMLPLKFCIHSLGIASALMRLLQNTYRRSMDKVPVMCFMALDQEFSIESSCQPTRRLPN